MIFPLVKLCKFCILTCLRFCKDSFRVTNIGVCDWSVVMVKEPPSFYIWTAAFSIILVSFWSIFVDNDIGELFIIICIMILVSFWYTLVNIGELLINIFSFLWQFYSPHLLLMRTMLHCSASENCLRWARRENWERYASWRDLDTGDLDLGQHTGALDSLGSQENVESHQLLLGKNTICIQ